MTWSEMSRRQFMQSLAIGGAAVIGAPHLVRAASAAGASAFGADGVRMDAMTALHPLRFAQQLTPDGITLTAAAGTADIGGGTMAPALMLNGSVPSPLLRVRRGAPFRVTMQNDLSSEFILHWHGLAPPVEMDGHPRFAVPSGAKKEYTFTVKDRAGTYWYHSHAHMRTGEHTNKGIGGLIIVSDAEEEALRLPSGARELPIILQDKRLDANGLPYYSTQGPAHMVGFMGTEPFANGVRRAFHEVETAVYRLRLLNCSNSRVFRLALSNGAAMTLIGNDGGLLPAPVQVTTMDLAPAERADLLLDLRAAKVGDVVMLQSQAFTVPGAMGFMGGANLQGQAMDLLEFRVAKQVRDTTRIPTRLPAIAAEFALPDAAQSQHARTFRFNSRMMDHTINDKLYEMSRVDETVPFGRTELWRFVNESSFMHPVHLHATHFRVVSRTGGRGALMPWEAGRKDTVLIWPNETVEVAVRFTAERGLFLLHCHNLEHEDMGMMANILVE